jgi:hypothetical protein
MAEPFLGTASEPIVWWQQADALSEASFYSERRGPSPCVETRPNGNGASAARDWAVTAVTHCAGPAGLLSESEGITIEVAQ